jgi:hypothetical protein
VEWVSDRDHHDAGAGLGEVREPAALRSIKRRVVRKPGVDAMLVIGVVDTLRSDGDGKRDRGEGECCQHGGAQGAQNRRGHPHGLPPNVSS